MAMTMAADDNDNKVDGDDATGEYDGASVMGDDNDDDDDGDDDDVGNGTMGNGAMGCDYDNDDDRRQ